jgi:predicted amidohydrolase YtcJ
MNKHLFLLVSLLPLWGSGVCQTPADLVLTQGNIITVQANGHRAEAVAIRGNQIVWVGKTADANPYIGPKTRVADLAGKTVIPGFNDAHLHPTPQYPFETPYATLQLDTVSSMNSLLTILRRKAAVTPDGMPITGYGYNEFRIGGQPLRDTLDQVSTRHPILISNVSGHYSAGNSLVFSLANITETTPDPAGGAFDRYVGTQRPNGLIRESARQLLRMPALPKPGPAEEYASYKRYFEDLLAQGITSMGDAGISPARLKIYEQLVAEGFPMRFNLMISAASLGKLLCGWAA